MIDDELRERVAHDAKGRLDEIVVGGGAVLEYMGGGLWFLGLRRADGSEIRLMIEGKVRITDDDREQ